MHILADPPPLPDTVPKAVATVVSRLLAKEPDERYADARDARRALSAAYTLPSKVTGVVGFAAVARDEPTDPPMPMAAPDSSAALLQAQAQAPTAAQSMASTRAEPLPPLPSDDSAELFVRSGGTVLAPPSGQAAASTSHGSMPMPMPGAAASMSHASVPIVPVSPSGPRFDPLAMSSPGLPVMGPGMHGSGGHPHSGVYGMLPPAGARRSTGPRTSTIVIVVLVLVTWVLIGLVWWTSRDDGRAGPGAAPAPAPSAGGLYRFAGDQAPAAGTPGASGAATVSPSDAKSDAKKPKKPKHDDGD